MDVKRSLNVFDLNDNKARKRVCLENKVQTSILEDLSNELIYDILEYLDGSEAYEVFSNQNARFDRLINSQSHRLKLNFSLISKLIFERRCQEMIRQQSNIDRIVSLRLSSELIINHFLKFFPINTFLRLESLVLDQIESNKLEAVLINLSLLPSLFSLSIHVNSSFQDENNVYRLIFRLPVLRYCNLKFPNGGEHTPLSMVINEEQHNKSIEHFIINGPCHIHQFIAILSHMPRLRIVRCHSLLGFANMQLETSMTLSNLKNLFLQLNNLPFSRFQLLISGLYSPLQSLGVCTTSNDDYIRSDNWIALISSEMDALTSFDLHYSNSISNDDDYDEFLRSIQHFQSMFWVERKWSFAHQHYSNRFEDEIDADSLVIFYSINPYRKHNYDLIECVSNSECSPNTYRNLARCLTIHDHHSIINCQVKFENVTSMVISNKYIDNDRWSIVDINRIVPLEKLTKLVVECDFLCINILFKIFNDAKGIQSLVLAPHDISDIQFPYIKQFDNDHTIINQSNVVQLVIRSICNLEQLQFLMNVFPHLKFLQLNINYNDYQSIIKFLFLKNPRKNPDLFALCLDIRGTNHDIVKYIKAFLDDQNLLDNYLITFSNNAVYLWW